MKPSATLLSECPCPIELRVYYKDLQNINTALDKAIEKAVEPFGLKRWASGFDLKTGERNLVFDNKKSSLEKD